jgi:hypothetical protein
MLLLLPLLLSRNDNETWPLRLLLEGMCVANKRGEDIVMVTVVATAPLFYRR